MNTKKYFTIFLLITIGLINSNNYTFLNAKENIKHSTQQEKALKEKKSNNDIQSLQTEKNRYPNYATMYVGEDKHEKFNRKMFNLNTKLNKYIARPVHIIWSSIIPKYGIDKIQNAYNNIEYPKRLASCLLQKDFKAIKTETARFLTNSTLGIGGLFDPADKLLKIKPVTENMDQALAKCKVPSGCYLVAPVLSACTPRSLCGRTLEAMLDPALYLATPITSIIKFGLMINRTSYMQPLAKMIESNFADPYDIQKKLFGLENYIKNSNYDRDNLLSSPNNYENSLMKDKIIANIDNPNQIYQDILALSELEKPSGFASNLENIKADIELDNFQSQTPVVDSMRTALFDNPEINKSIWNELSIWNRSFAKRIKSDEINIDSNRKNYTFYYILQKDKTAPLAIFYPSIGENANAHHSIVFAKLFYDAGYSVVLQGSHFNWEFVYSMPKNYYPGLPQKDSEYTRLVSAKIIQKLNDKYNTNFKKKIIVGTSFGAVSTLFVASKENEDNTLGVDKFIAISPPIELLYAINQLDNYSEELEKVTPETKDKIAITAAKILQITKLKDQPNFNIDTLPFSDEEGKLITTFILRQKLSDLMFAIENISKGEKTDFYEKINNMSYKDYVTKYLIDDNIKTLEDIGDESNLYSLSAYFENNDNYKIYESLDDYFINKSQLSKLKNIAKNHLICFSNGAHLGFLYRPEFIEELKKDLIF